MAEARHSQDHACPIRDVLDRLGDAWTVLVLMKLAKGPGRLNALRRVIGAISQRMPAVTLRHPERDGLVRRTVLPLSPPQVEYALTPLGESFVAAVRGLAVWSAAHQPQVRAARAAWDGRARA